MSTKSFSLVTEWLNDQLTKEEPSSRGVHDGVLRWDSQDLHDTSQLFHLVLSREQRVARVQLCENTACTQTHLQLNLCDKEN